MPYGFRSINDSGEVIVSDEFQNLHFIGKAIRDTSSDSTAAQFDQQSGSEQSNFFPDFTGSNIIPGATDELDGRVLINYTITTTGRPLAFIKPDLDAYDRWYAIISQTEGTSNLWTFEVLMSGIAVNNFPELFIFVDANEIPASVFNNDTHGMVVYKPDGVTKTFDSRAQPLSILGVGLNTPRDFAPNDGTPVTTGQFSSVFAYEYDSLDHNFHSNGSQDIGNCGPGLPGTFIQGMTEDNCTGAQGETNWVDQVNDPDFGNVSVTTNVNTNTKPHTDMMFACPSIGQAVFQRQAHGHNVGTSDFSTAAWWVMYRAAYRLQPHATNPGNNKVRFNAGWGTYAAGYNYIIGAEAENWNGVQPGDTRTGWAEGLQPYNSGVSINDQSVTMIVADSTKYT